MSTRFSRRRSRANDMAHRLCGRRGSADERGIILVVVIILATVILAATALTVVSVAQTSNQATFVVSKQMAQTTAQTGADLFYSALNGSSSSSFPGAACMSNGSPQPLCDDVFPASLGVSPQTWYQVGPTGLTPCPSGGNPASSQVTCLAYSDDLAQLSYGSGSSTPSTTTPITPYVINLQVTVRTNCHYASGAYSTTPTGCAYSRLDQRLQPRQFTNYLEYTNSEMLDPALVAGNYGTYESWYSSCTNGTGQVLSDTQVHGVVNGTPLPGNTQCPVPDYLANPSSNNGLSGDSLNGPLATNDQTIFFCNSADQQNNIATAAPQAAGTPPTTEDQVPVSSTVNGQQLCSGPGNAPTGQTRAASQLPISAVQLSQFTSAVDTYSGSTYIDLCGTYGSAKASSYLVTTGTYPNGAQCSAGSTLTSKSWPATGVIYVNGDAYVSGQACAGVTIAASGNIYIVNNLTAYRDHQVATCQGSIGLVSSHSVVVEPELVGQTCGSQGPCYGSPSNQQIACWPTTVTLADNTTQTLSSCMDVDAAVMALGYGGGTSLPSPDASQNTSCPYDATVQKYVPKNSGSAAVGYWPFSTSTTTTAGSSSTSSDISSNGNNASWTGSAANVSSVNTSPIACNVGSSDSALSVNGGAVATSAIALSGIQEQQGTVGMWVKMNAGSTSTGMLAGLGSPQTDGYYGDQVGLYIGTNGTPVFAGNSHGQYGSLGGDSMTSLAGSAGTLNDGTWHFVSASWCGGNSALAAAGTASCQPGAQLFVDGTQVASTTGPVWPTVLGGATYSWTFGQNTLGAGASSACPGWPSAGTTDCTLQLGTDVSISRAFAASSALNITEMDNIYNAALVTSTAATSGGSFYLDGWNRLTPPGGTGYQSVQASWSAQQVDTFGGQLTALNCTSATWCLAGSSDGRVWLFNGASWTLQNIGQSAQYAKSITGISCIAQNQCLVGAESSTYSIFYLNQGTWGRLALTYNPTQLLSCPAGGPSCIVVENGLTTSVVTFPSSGVPQITATGTPPGSLNTIQCVTTSTCYGLYWNGLTPYFTEWNGVVWSQGLAVAWSNPSGAVSAPSMTFGQCSLISCQVGMTDGTEFTYKIPAIASGYSASAVDVSSGTGSYSSCAVSTQGQVLCWGNNAYGQIGNGNTVDTTSPVPVSNITTGATSVSAGHGFACALVNGGVWCWGLNNHGQLGNGSTTNSSVPVQVSGLASGVASISTGYGTACAVMTSGSMECWGWNSEGQLGNGTRVDSSLPVVVADPTGTTTLAGVTQASVGVTNSGATPLGDSVCAVITGGSLDCWGGNPRGELGNGTTTDSALPTQVPSLASGVNMVSTYDDTTCIVTTSYNAQCWGAGTSGQLGNHATNDSTTPVNVLDSTGTTQFANVTQIAAGPTSCASVTGGSIKCWGSNTSGTIGNGSTTPTSLPTAVVGITGNASSITVNAQTACAIVSNVPECWGGNSNGQLGNNSPTSGNDIYPNLVANFVGSGDSFVQVAGTTATGSMCGIDQSGNVYCWGTDANIAASFSPTQVTGISNAVQIVDDGIDACALNSSGNVYCWGSNTYGGVGNGTTTAKTTPVSITSGASWIAAGNGTTCAVVFSAAKCWGNNDQGQLGIASTTNQTKPVAVNSPGNANVSEIAVGTSTMCLLGSSNAMYCTGSNTYGQLGNGGTTSSTSLVAVSGSLAVATPSSYVRPTIASGPYGTCAVGTNGKLYCWGYNYYDQVGNGSTGSTTPVTSPYLISSSSNVTSVAYGSQTTVGAVRHGATVCYTQQSSTGPAGNVYCQGNNTQGAVGNGTNTIAPAHTLAVGYTANSVSSIGVGNNLSCAVENIGPTVCWGGNSVSFGNNVAAIPTSGQATIPVGGAGTPLGGGIISFVSGHPLLSSSSGGAQAVTYQSGYPISAMDQSLGRLAGTNSGQFLAQAPVIGNSGGGFYPISGYSGSGINALYCATANFCMATNDAGQVLTYQLPAGATVCGVGVTTCALLLNGSVTESFRGAMGLFSGVTAGSPVLTTGIAKSFAYDQYLSYSQPPYFLSPAQGAWQRVGSTYTGAQQR